MYTVTSKVEFKGVRVLPAAQGQGELLCVLLSEMSCGGPVKQSSATFANMTDK